MCSETSEQRTTSDWDLSAFQEIKTIIITIQSYANTYMCWELKISLLYRGFHYLRVCVTEVLLYIYIFRDHIVKILCWLSKFIFHPLNLPSTPPPPAPLMHLYAFRNFWKIILQHFFNMIISFMCTEAPLQNSQSIHTKILALWAIKYKFWVQQKIIKRIIQSGRYL